MTSSVSRREQPCSRCGSKLVKAEWDERVNEREAQVLWRCRSCNNEFVTVVASEDERSPERATQRNGYRVRPWDTRVGTLELQIPKLRQGSYFPSWLEPRRRAEQALVAVVAEAYVQGVSTRKVEALVQALKATGKATYVALHVNHARELGPKARAACARLVDAGVPMLSQTVLLRGVNDDAASLGELMRSLVECRVKPYYLHHGDLALGTAHWRSSIEQGQSIMRSMRGRLSGLCQPTYVLDIPGGHGKSPIGPNYISATSNGANCQYEVEDFKGGRHSYPPEA